MKNIIQRSLPLNVLYSVIDKKYIPIMEGGGCLCDNCGKLIANIATVKSSNGYYNIGFDCLETFLLNNNLLEGFTLEELTEVKKMIAQVLRFAKTLKETLSKNKSLNITGLKFETPLFSDSFTFYYLQNNSLLSKNNDYVKLKGMKFLFLIDTLKNIFPNLNIITE